MPNNLWTTSQAADAWGISESRVRRLCIAGRVPGAHKAVTDDGMNATWVMPPQPKPEEIRPGIKKSAE